MLLEQTIQPIGRSAGQHGFTHFGDSSVCAGLLHGKTVYLTVWNLCDDENVTACIPNVCSAAFAYPQVTDAVVRWYEASVKAHFPRSYMAVFLEIEIA